MASLAQLVSHWRLAAEEPAHGAYFATQAGDAAKRAAFGEVADELAAALGSGQTSAEALETFAQSLKRRAFEAQQQAVQVSGDDPRAVESRHEVWLGRAVAYALCAAEVHDFIPASEG